MRVLVTGATGLIGRRLLPRLDHPRVLARDPERARRSLGEVDAIAWDAGKGPPPASALEGIDAIVHLAGEPVAVRWSEERKAAIRDSRVAGTRRLVEAIAARPASSRPRVLISSSAVGIYGDRGDETLDETSSLADDFLAQVCRDWEAEALKARDLGLRVVLLRTGVVLDPAGGALGKMVTPFKLCLGGRLSHGRQWMPWIHVDDELGLILHALANDKVEGPINATAPNPATNRDFTRALARALGRPAIFPVPGFILKILFGAMSSVVLGSERVLPRAAEKTGYRFAHPELDEALASLLKKAPSGGQVGAPSPA
jgi:uncharacterized protein (TIGR01777 family)